MEIDDLKSAMDQQFQQVDDRFQQADDRFEQVDGQFVALRREVEAVRHAIAAEGERTRRHFDAVAEQMKSERNLVLDQSTAVAQQLARFTASNAGAHGAIERRLDDHEHRITRMEGASAKRPKR